MKRKYLLWAAGLLVAAAVIYGYKEYNRKREDSKTLEAKFRVTASDLLKEFSADEQAATLKYKGLDVIVSVSGPLKEIKKDEKGFYTLLLGDSSDLSSVQCSMDTLYTADLSDVKAGQPIVVKGAFTGYNSDITGMLGSDIQLNRCVLDTKK